MEKPKIQNLGGIPLPQVLPIEGLLEEIEQLVLEKLSLTITKIVTHRTVSIFGPYGFQCEEKQNVNEKIFKKLAAVD